MEEITKKKTYVKPQAFPVVFSLNDIVVTSYVEEDTEEEPFGAKSVGAVLRNIDNNLPF